MVVVIALWVLAMIAGLCWAPVYTGLATAAALLAFAGTSGPALSHWTGWLHLAALGATPWLLAAKRLRDSGLFARTVTLTIRYAGFETHTRAKTLSEPTDLDAVVVSTSRNLLEGNWDRRRKVRLLGVALSAFSASPAQLDLLDAGRRERLERLARATDRLRDRFGFSKIQLGGSLKNEE